MANAVPGLPSRDSFLEKDLEIITTCAICHDPFNDSHLPARPRGMKRCSHIFGLTCLRRWLESDAVNANTCPICRTVLFKTERKPNFTHRIGEPISERWIENLDCPRARGLFIWQLWQETWKLYDIDVITDSDIEEAIYEAAFETGCWVHGAGMYIARPTMLCLIGIAKEMTIKHYNTGKYRKRDGTFWASDIRAVLGWVEVSFSEWDELDIDD